MANADLGRLYIGGGLKGPRWWCQVVRDLGAFVTAQHRGIHRDLGAFVTAQHTGASTRVNAGLMISDPVL